MNTQATAHGKPVDANMMKLIQGYMMAVLVGNDKLADYFADKIAKADAKN